jgi:hypothetical protein
LLSVLLFPTPNFVSLKWLKPPMQHVDEKEGVPTDDSRARGGSLGAISANSYSSLLPVTFSEWTELTEEVSSLVLRSEAYCMTTGLCRGR